MPWTPSLAEVSRSSLTLDLLGSNLSVTSPDDRWIEFLRRLWEPFVVPTAEPDGTVSVGPPEWTVRSSWHADLVTPDVWMLANEIRYLMVERAIDLAPDVVILHGAALEKAGVVVVIAGDSGVGKTTLTLDLVDRGWTYLTDDVVPVEIETGRIRSFPKPLGIKDLSRWAALGEKWADLEWPPPPTDGFLLPPGSLPLVAPGEVRFVTNLVFLGKSDDRVEENPLSSAQALVRCGELVRGFDQETLRGLAHLCRGSRSMELFSNSAFRSAQFLDKVLRTHSQ